LAHLEQLAHQEVAVAVVALYQVLAVQAGQHPLVAEEALEAGELLWQITVMAATEAWAWLCFCLCEILAALRHQLLDKRQAASLRWR
jgi:hypothetical protein